MTDLPAEIERYPHLAFGGGELYLVGDEWYYSTPQGWFILREEPPQLSRHRLDIDRASPAIAGYLVVPVGEAPPGIFSAPCMPFAGSRACLVRDDWYYPTAEGWAWFVQVPSELRACRIALRREASPAQHPAGGIFSTTPPGCPVR